MTALVDLEFIPYIDEQGQLPSQLEGKVGVYAIFDQGKKLQVIGYSRDIALSLKQHLVRQPHKCYWLKVETVDRPSRTVLENIRETWIAETGEVPPGNSADEALWHQPIDAKARMTVEEQAIYSASDEIGKIKTLKQLARRVEEEVLETLTSRGVNMTIRFDPKLKEEGLLNLK